MKTVSCFPIIFHFHHGIRPRLFGQPPALTVLLKNLGCWEIFKKGFPEFKGRFLPWLLAAGDKYVKPAVRYQGRAYDSGIDFLLPVGYFTLWSTEDPDIESTLSVFNRTGQALAGLKLTPEDLQGYILSAYAQALPPIGILNSRMRAMRRYIMGISTVYINEMIRNIRNSTVHDQKEASDLICRLLKSGPVSVVGNEKIILEYKNRFDEY